jgi:arabinofuranosyltransferase
MLWRIDYFGYPFPNTFYIKVSTGQGIVKAAGIDYVRSFGDDILAPYLALLLGLSVYRLRQNFAPESLLKLIPIIVGGMLFGFYLLTITPIQGVVWRFIFPILPALLLASIYYIVDLLPQRAEVNRWLSVVMLFFFAAWTLRHMPLALFYRRAATQDDRAKVGRALAGLPGTMFTSESGALPYYSGWRAIDSLGINSEEIAHQGLSLQTLSALNPDLIVLSVDGRYSGAGNEVINQYMIDHGFVAVAAIHKALDLRHFYLARPDSPLFDAIVKRLLNVRDVQYGDLEELMDEARIPLVSGRSPEQ